MTQYLVRRMAQAVIAVLFIVTLIVFAMLHFLPGSPARALLGIQATPGAIAAFNEANGYNRSLPVQYVLYLDRLAHGNLGFSYHFDQSVRLPADPRLAEERPCSWAFPTCSPCSSPSRWASPRRCAGISRSTTL